MHRFCRKGCQLCPVGGVCASRHVPAPEGTTMKRLMLIPTTALLSSEACEASEHSLSYGGSWPETLIVVTVLLIAARKLVNWLDRISQFREK